MRRVNRTRDSEVEVIRSLYAGEENGNTERLTG